MNIRILGAHSCETQSANLTSLLIDDMLAIDAGGLARALSVADMQKIAAVLLTHQHYDHIQDVTTLGRILSMRGQSVNVYSIQDVYDVLHAHLLNGKIADRFLQEPDEEHPTIHFNIIRPYQNIEINGYHILAVPVNHTVPTVGYQVTSPDGKSLFYTGDTRPSLSNCWEHISPQLILIDTSLSNRYEKLAMKLGHLTPNLLRQELDNFRRIKGYLPRVVTVHMDPLTESEVETEIAAMNESLGGVITFGHDGMELQL